MKTSVNGVEFIKRWEGCVLDWYQDNGGNWTIGYGHMDNGMALPDGFTAPLTAEAATALLALDLGRYEAIVDERFPDFPFNQNQYDALVSFAYNLGEIGWSLYAAIIENADTYTLKSRFMLYCHMGGEVIQGLLDRRVEEWELYVTPVEETQPEPAPAPDNTPDEYAASAVRSAIAKGVIRGDEHGNYMLHQPVTRQDTLVLLERAGIL